METNNKKTQRKEFHTHCHDCGKFLTKRLWKEDKMLILIAIGGFLIGFSIACIVIIIMDEICD